MKMKVIFRNDWLKVYYLPDSKFFNCFLRLKNKKCFSIVFCEDKETKKIICDAVSIAFEKQSVHDAQSKVKVVPLKYENELKIKAFNALLTIVAISYDYKMPNCDFNWEPFFKNGLGGLEIEPKKSTKNKKESFPANPHDQEMPWEYAFPE